MTYYHLPTGTERNPRPGERRTDTGEWLTPPDGVWSPADAALCGFLPIITQDRPADTSAGTWDRTVQVIDGTPCERWTARPWTDAGQAAQGLPAGAARVATLLAVLEVFTVQEAADVVGLPPETLVAEAKAWAAAATL